MTPTNQLRFVERKVKLSPFYLSADGKGNLVPATKTYRILQQLWTENYEVVDEFGNHSVATEWRDVPVEVES